MMMGDDIVVLLYLSLHHLNDRTLFVSSILHEVIGCFLIHFSELSLILENSNFFLYLFNSLTFGYLLSKFSKSDIGECRRRSGMKLIAFILAKVRGQTISTKISYLILDVLMLVRPLLVGQDHYIYLLIKLYVFKAAANLQLNTI